MSRLLITGGTGSFGLTYVQRLLKDSGVEEIRIFSRDEKKQHDMRQRLGDDRITYVIGDVRDRDAVQHASQGVDFIFHAAALKQVPTGEFFPLELVKTNIMGTEHVFDAARRNGVKKVVLLSTDKAVYPINVMGMTKAIAEKLMVAHARNTNGTCYSAVRYGNVMASRGSVIPLFIEQIQRGVPITITDPTMTRFMLSLEHAGDLVEFALAHGGPGDLFIVKKAPATTVKNIADALLRIFNAHNEIKILGMRHGEKLHEAFATRTELMSAEAVGDYLRINSERALDYDKYFVKGEERAVAEDYTSANTTQLTLDQTEQLLRELPYVQRALGNTNAVWHEL